MRECLAVVKALADENRTRTVMFLRGGELCVCQIVELLQLAPSTVSKHLTILRHAGLVESRKDGRWIYYRLPDRRAPACVRKAIRWVRSSLQRDSQITRDASRLKAIRKMDVRRLCARYRG